MNMELNHPNELSLSIPRVSSRDSSLNSPGRGSITPQPITRDAAQLYAESFTTRSPDRRISSPKNKFQENVAYDKPTNSPSIDTDISPNSEPIPPARKRPRVLNAYTFQYEIGSYSGNTTTAVIAAATKSASMRNSSRSIQSMVSTAQTFHTTIGEEIENGLSPDDDSSDESIKLDIGETRIKNRHYEELVGGMRGTNHNRQSQTIDNASNQLVQGEPLLILVVDDSVIQRKLTEFKLTGNFNGDMWHVLTAETGEVALQLCASASRRPDVIIMDHNMSSAGGQLLGHEVVANMRRMSDFKDVVIIGCTGFVEEAEQQFIDAGCDAVWRKPMPSKFEAIAEIVNKRNERLHVENGIVSLGSPRPSNIFSGRSIQNIGMEALADDYQCDDEMDSEDDASVDSYSDDMSSSYISSSGSLSDNLDILDEIHDQASPHVDCSVLFEQPVRPHDLIYPDDSLIHHHHRNDQLFQTHPYPSGMSEIHAVKGPMGETSTHLNKSDGGGPV